MKTFLRSTVPLPDGVILTGPWPGAVISWPNGNFREATKPEYDLFQALEQAHVEIGLLNEQILNERLLSQRFNHIRRFF